ncbi:hypothetical protein B4114_1383 [Geobacillus stearothermophilus]|uniref:Uncharacterized protein n=1 Tax=Geobacillus stearothermophilus TaxID=1422 RepID=A0A150NFR2_GEOSE|nr:hypothetical protein B4114_1383 [Geobacillus stearothermophilus]
MFFPGPQPASHWRQWDRFTAGCLCFACALPETHARSPRSGGTKRGRSLRNS